MTQICKKAAQRFHCAVLKVFDRVKSVALCSANIRKLAKGHKGYGSAAKETHVYKLRLWNIICINQIVKPIIEFLKRLLKFSFLYSWLSNYSDLWLSYCLNVRLCSYSVRWLSNYSDAWLINYSNHPLRYDSELWLINYSEPWPSNN